MTVKYTNKISQVYGMIRQSNGALQIESEVGAGTTVRLYLPRAGAEAQARALAKSQVPLIAYVSCDAASFARDAAILVKGGYKIGPVTPVDQFLWSPHIELVGGFHRPKGR